MTDCATWLACRLAVWRINRLRYSSATPKLPDGCVDLIYIAPPFNSNRNYEVFWGDQSEPRAQASGSSAQTESRHAGTAAYIDYMRPRVAGDVHAAVD